MSCRTWPPETPPPPPPPPPKPPPEPGTPPSFFYAASYYGALTATSSSTWTSDLTKLRQLGVSNVRVWVDWPGWEGGPAGNIVQPNGSLSASRVAQFQQFLTIAGALKMKVDMTFGGAGDASFIEYTSFNAWHTGLRNMATTFKDWTMFYPVDVHNEFKAGTHKSGGELTIAHIVQATQEVHAIAPSWPITCSTDGDSGSCAIDYAQMIGAGAYLNVLAPHFPRYDSDWGEKVEGRVNNVRNVLLTNFGIAKPIYVQEENRDEYTGGTWSVEQSTAAALGSRKSKAVGYCFHTVAGFDLSHGTFFDQLSAAELEALKALPKGGLTP